MVRGEPSMLFIKLEKPLFLRPADGFINSPEKRLGLDVAYSDLGGVVSMVCPPGGMVWTPCSWCWRRSGLVCVCIKGGGGGLVGAGPTPPSADADCIEDKRPDASNGAPTRSVGWEFGCDG